MARKKVATQPEDDSVVAARQRQVLDLAKLDEEENRRIKQMRTVSRGLRAFRAVRGAARSASASTSSGVGGASAPAGTGSYEAQVSALNQYMSGG